MGEPVLQPFLMRGAGSEALPNTKRHPTNTKTDTFSIFEENGLSRPYDNTFLTRKNGSVVLPNTKKSFL